ncbi:MAG: conjugal transfer protein [Acutalibacteraceae bacterium]|nr:conjugal transfer protein [Acutalibacteraceae bacterium]
MFNKKKEVQIPHELSRAEKKQQEKLRKKQEKAKRAKEIREANKKKNALNAQEVSSTLQGTIPYRAVYSNGVIETSKGVYTKSYMLKDVNYQAAKLEDQTTMFLKYSELLNSFDSSVRIQISINNRNIDQEQFKEETLLPLKSNNLDTYINEYNDMIVDKMSEGKNNMARDKYLTVSVEAESFEAACNLFSRLDTEITNATKKIGGSEAIALSTVERLSILHNILNIGHEGEFEVDKENAESWLKDLTMKGWDTKDVIIPNGIEFKSDYIEIGDKVARVLYLKELPSYLPDTIISELTDCDRNMITSLNISIVPQDKALKICRNQLTNINSNIVDRQQKAAKHGYDPTLIGHDLQKAQDEANQLLDDLTSKDQKMFLLTMVIMHFADDLEQLNKDTDSIITVGRKYSCDIRRLRTQQELGFKSALPLCNNQLFIQRTLTTASTAVFMPFTSQELNQKNGRYYGLNAISRNLILFNRENCKNGNGFILGTPGSGKSMTGKIEMSNVILGTDDEIIVIDPENEYCPLIEILGGEIIPIEAGGNNYINPLDMDSAYAGEKGKDPIVLKTDFVLSLCETVCGGSWGLTPSQKSIIDRCVRAVYREYLASEYINEDGEKCYDQSKLPTLLDFQALLASQRDREAKEIALALELYTAGSLDNFAHYTNVDVNNRFIAYNLRDVGDNMMTMAMLVILDSIWNRILRNHRLGKKTWVYVDEAHLLFANKTSATFLKTLYKRSRKFNGYITCITQNVSDILENPICKTMIGNSEFLILLNQSADDREKLAEQLGLSETQLSYITAANPGEGLLINTPNIVPFINKFPRDTELYKAMTTKPADLIEYRKQKAKERAENE